LTLSKSLEGSTFKKNLSILGSTGSIGTQTLDIVRARPENFRVTSLSAGRNLELLVDQIVEFEPSIVSVQDPSDISTLKSMLKGKFTPKTIVGGEEGILEVAKDGDSDTMVTGIVGAAGLKPTIEGIQRGKDIALGE
jgi:1-deoxy-D-xylulose-5-phosphate reductoisomerase